LFEIDRLSKYRVDLSGDDLQKLVQTINDFNKNQNLEIAKSLSEQISHHLNNGKEVKYSTKKQIAASNATKLRVQKARQRIENAVNILRMENKNITMYAVAKVSGCSINTVKKYKEFITGQQVIQF